MALSFTEKRNLQKIVSEKQAALESGNLSFKEKREAQKALDDALAKLGAGVVVSEVQKSDEPATHQQATMDDVNAAFPLLKQFIGVSQLEVMVKNTKGEEGQFFIDMIRDLADLLRTMPKTYEQDGKGDDAEVYLHYFKGGSDWYITERDKEDEQLQAFGYAILNGDKQNAELGYINISELIKYGVELDLYWDKKTLGRIKGNSDGPKIESTPTVADVGNALEKSGWIPDGNKVWKIEPEEGKRAGSYLVSGTDQSESGSTGYMMLDYWDKNAWEPLGRSVEFRGNTVDDIVHEIETMIYEHERISKAGGNEKLADLIAGQYNDQKPEDFLLIVRDIIKEIQDIEPVKAPVVAYIEANKDKISAVMESALSETFGMLWDKTKDFPLIGQSTQPAPSTSDAVRIKPQDGDYGPPKKISIDIDDDFYGPTAFRPVIRSIEEAREADTIEIKINSNGGDTQAAQAIYVALLKTPAKTKAIIINAYSAGSIVAMACDEIEPTPFCTMMIHNASTFSGGKLGDLAGKAAFLNDYFGEWFQQLYAGFLTEDELKDIIKGQDFWLKEPQIRERLKNWKPIRQRLQEDGMVKAA